MTDYTNFFSARPVKLADNWTSKNIGIQWVGDLNGDGNTDLIVPGASYPNNGNIPQQGYVLVGDNKGNFTPLPSTTFPNASLKTVHSREIVTADFNNDGVSDIFIASHGYDIDPFPGEQNKLFLSRKDGTWTDETGSLPQLLDFSHSATIGDINGDGWKDIFVGNLGGGDRSIQTSYALINDGTGHFTKSTDVIPALSGQVLSFEYNGYTASLLADLNGDIKDELIVGTMGGNSKNGSKILWNTGAGFNNNNVTNFPAGHQAGSDFITGDICAIDVNNDGLNDIIALSTSNNPFYQGAFIDVYLNKGNNSFDNATQQVIGSSASHIAGNWSVFLTKIDANNDGLIDVAMSQYSGPSQTSPDSVFLLLNKGNGTFQSVTYGDISADHNMFSYDAMPIRTSLGIGFVSPYAINGILSGNELLATKPLPKFAYGVGELDLQGSRSDYTILQTANSIAVTDNVANRDGTQTLLDIQQRIKFQDGSLVFDVTNNTGNALVYRIYKAAFARTPDEGGFRFWVDQHNVNGLDFNSMASAFRTSDEFRQKYGDLTNNDYVTKLYSNVLGRTPDSDGLSWWQNQLNSGNASRDQVLIGFAGSSENIKGTAPNIDHGYWLI